jgi:lysyl-tRNA synthetase, class I
VADVSPQSDWVNRFADEVIAEAARRSPGKPVVVASGLSPSGPIHLGNLREMMVPHLVADEIKRRGVPCEHILSWDDFDRLRRVPAGVDSSWAQHIGKPLTSVPAPPGSPYPNWAEHFKAPMAAALARLGVDFRGISQTQMYTSGAYVDQVLLAMRERTRIDGVLSQYRTKPPAAVAPGVGAAAGTSAAGHTSEAADTSEAAEAAEGSGAAAEDDGATSAGYFPYRPYCAACERDLTTVTGYDDESTKLTYTCACGHAETVRLAEHRRGKLVWKVDWPMRWAYEGVVFEPSGADHQAPGSSFVVGGRLVSEIFGGSQPIGPGYAFVGISGMSKMSSSHGAVPTPADALDIMEEPVLRWLYARRRPQQSFTIAFGTEIQRLYDEWDSVARKVADGTASQLDASSYDRAIRTAAGELPRTPRPLPYRMLASVADITTGDSSQIQRILSDTDPGHPLSSLDEVQPRLDRARCWAMTQLPADERTRLAAEPDRSALAGLSPAERSSLDLLLAGLNEDWSLEGLSRLVYAVPKLQAGLSADAPATPELKSAQRVFFALVYRLLIGRETGPRLPTLLLAAGQDRIRSLLAG